MRPTMATDCYEISIDFRRLIGWGAGSSLLNDVKLDTATFIIAQMCDRR